MQKKTSRGTKKKALVCEKNSQIAANGSSNRQLSLNTFFKTVKQECWQCISDTVYYFILVAFSFARRISEDKSFKLFFFLTIQIPSALKY